jgi:PKD repeat protein
MKGLAIQPTADGKDLVYLFTKAKNDKPGTCWYRKEGMSDWASFNNNYPVNYRVNIGLPFFRNSKLRIGGSGGVWESPLAEPDFTPIVNPWVQSPICECTLDTLYFDDHSMLNHEGASWHWEITPEPVYQSDPDQRRFKVVPGATGAFTVTLTATQNGQSYSKTVENMVYVNSCPSVYDCDSPGDVPKGDWSVLYVDSQEPAAGNPAQKAIDGDENTIWHTEWVYTDPDPGPPHEIQIDMADTFYVHEFTYLPRQDGSYNGTIKEYEFYVSDSLGDDSKPVWGEAVSKGTWESSTAPKVLKFDGAPLKARFFRLVGLSEVNDNPWASAAELSVKGCYWTPQEPSGIRDAAITELKAFPVPAGDYLHVPLPLGERFTWKVFSLCGAVVDQGTVEGDRSLWDYDASALKPGTYLMQLRNETNGIYRVKFQKMK